MNDSEIIKEVKEWEYHLKRIGSKVTKEKLIQKCAELLWKSCSRGEFTRGGENILNLPLDEYRFYIVDHSLAERLRDNGEFVLDGKDFSLWNRQGGGQEPWIDLAIHKIAEDLIDSRY